MILSTSVGDGGGVSIEVVVVISAVVTAIVVMGVRVVRLRGAALFFVVLVFAVMGVFLSSARFGGLCDFSGVSGVFLLSWSHKGLSKRHCYGS